MAVAEARAICERLERQHDAAVAAYNARQTRANADACKASWATLQAAERALLRAILAQQAMRWADLGHHAEARTLDQALRDGTDDIGLIVLSTRLVADMSGRIIGGGAA